MNRYLIVGRITFSHYCSYYGCEGHFYDVNINSAFYGNTEEEALDSALGFATNCFCAARGRSSAFKFYKVLTMWEEGPTITLDILS